MKHSSILLLAVPALLLVGCGKTGAKDSNGVNKPAGGTSASLKEGAPKLAKAVAGTASSDAIGAKLSIPSLSFAGNIGDAISLSVSATKLESATSITGYNATKVADLKMSNTESFEALALGFSMGSGDHKMNYDFSAKKGSISSYLANGNAYLDLSNPAVHSALVSTLGGSNSIQASLVAETTPEKVSIADVIEDDDLPLIDVDELTKEIGSYASTLSAQAATYDKYFTLVDYKDGSSTLYGKFDASTVATIAATAENEGSSSADVSSAAESMVAELGADAKLDFSVSISYDESHLLSFAAGFNISLTVDGKVASSGVASAIALKGNLTGEFSYGSDVKVSLPDDFSSYQAMSLTGGSSSSSK